MKIFTRFTLLVSLVIGSAMHITAAPNRIKQPLFDEASADLFNAWAIDHVKYPKELRNKGLAGTLKVEFILRASGNIDSIVVTQTPHPSFVEDVKRVVKESQSLWTPAKIKRQPVDYHINANIRYASKYTVKVPKNERIKGYPHCYGQIIVLKDKDGSAEIKQPIREAGSPYDDKSLPSQYAVAYQDVSMSGLTWDEALTACKESTKKGSGRLPSIYEMSCIYLMGGTTMSIEQVNNDAFIEVLGRSFRLRGNVNFTTLYGCYWLMDKAEDGKRKYADLTSGELVIKSADPNKKLLVRPIVEWNPKQNDFFKHVKGDIPKYIKPDVLPRFQGGDLKSFRSWIISSLKYPHEMAERKIQGRVIIRFEVNEDGKVTNLATLSSPHYQLTKEVYRILLDSPKWDPAELKGRKIKTIYTIPVVFSINK